MWKWIHREKKKSTYKWIHYEKMHVEKKLIMKQNTCGNKLIMRKYGNKLIMKNHVEINKLWD